MNLHGLVEAVLEENRDLIGEVPKEAVDGFIQGIEQAGKIFCAAQGRSGYILRSFCMRLMHLGYRAFFVGETVSPKIGKGDILVVVSGSGETTCTYEWVKVGRQEGATTYGVIGVEDSPIGRALDYTISLPGGSKGDLPREPVSIQPPGSLFEQAAFVLLESIVLALYQRQGSDRRALLDRHANLE
ncbi:MAG: SIS domain-containing protein [Desulfobacterales bacterium]|nr:SIS domain-containing protein [Desulfobacterales bacterium]